MLDRILVIWIFLELDGDKKMIAEYPNLELMEYMLKQMLASDKEWKKKFEEIKKERKYAFLDIDVRVFLQIWGSTCTAFDVAKDGTPAIGGRAMTKAYTAVFHEHLTDTYVVFVDGKPCYKVDNAPPVFFEDLKNCNMKSLSEAKKYY